MEPNVVYVRLTELSYRLANALTSKQTLTLDDVQTICAAAAIVKHVAEMDARLHATVF